MTARSLCFYPFKALLWIISVGLVTTYDFCHWKLKVIIGVFYSNGSWCGVYGPPTGLRGACKSWNRAQNVPIERQTIALIRFSMHFMTHVARRGKVTRSTLRFPDKEIEAHRWRRICWRFSETESELGFWSLAWFLLQLRLHAHVSLAPPWN